MPAITVEQALQIALTHHQAGRLAEAEKHYRAILAVQPRYADALHFTMRLLRQSAPGDWASLIARVAVELHDFVSRNLGSPSPAPVNPAP